MPSGLTLVHPHHILLVELGGTSMTPASVRGRLSLTRKEKLGCKVCLHTHLEPGGMPPVERGRWSLFFYLTDQSVQFSRSVVSDSLQPHELQHAGPPCPSPNPGVHPDSRRSSQCIQPSHPLSYPSPPAPNPSQHQSLFQ